MKGPSSQNTNHSTESGAVSDNGCQTDWKTTYQPSQGAPGGNVWSSYSSSANQASASSSSSSSSSTDGLIEELFDEEKKKKHWEFNWRVKMVCYQLLSVSLCRWTYINIKSFYKSYKRYKFLFNMRKRRQQGSHKIFQYWKSRDVCKEIILLPSIGVSKLWFYHISSKYTHYPTIHSSVLTQLPSHNTVLNEDWSWYSPARFLLFTE